MPVILYFALFSLISFAASWITMLFFLKRTYSRIASTHLESARLHLSCAIADLDKKVCSESTTNQAEILSGLLDQYETAKANLAKGATLPLLLSTAKLSYFSQSHFELIRALERTRPKEHTERFEHLARVDIPNLISTLSRKKVISQDDKRAVEDAQNFVHNCTNPDHEYRAYVHKCLIISALTLRKQILLS